MKDCNLNEMNDYERWEAVGKPEIICHDDSEGGGVITLGQMMPRVSASFAALMNRRKIHAIVRDAVNPYGGF